MSDNRFDLLTRHAGSVFDRRATLKTLGVTAILATFSRSPATQARKNGTTKPKKWDRCKRQDGQCRAFFTDLCAPQQDPRSCEELLLPCCSILGQCQPTSFFACLLSAA
jgi:hypothetical protein